MERKATTRRTMNADQIDRRLQHILGDLVLNVREGCPVAHRIFMDRTMYLIKELFGYSEEDDNN